MEKYFDNWCGMAGHDCKGHDCELSLWNRFRQDPDKARPLWAYLGRHEDIVNAIRDPRVDNAMVIVVSVVRYVTETILARPFYPIGIVGDGKTVDAIEQHAANMVEQGDAQWQDVRKWKVEAYVNKMSHSEFLPARAAARREMAERMEEIFRILMPDGERDAVIDSIEQSILEPAMQLKEQMATCMNEFTIEFSDLSEPLKASAVALDENILERTEFHSIDSLIPFWLDKSTTQGSKFVNVDNAHEYLYPIVNAEPRLIMQMDPEIVKNIKDGDIMFRDGLGCVKPQTTFATGTPMGSDARKELDMVAEFDIDLGFL
ncbi:hypothetical protein BJ166DRAFT_278709 [Pestalotiopsis sp. NC0098]|nr:hypothetical protein BJ166DRAFT_278709 [Pestalotiopsis sp. NC0098]